MLVGGTTHFRIKKEKEKKHFSSLSELDLSLNLKDVFLVISCIEKVTKDY